MADYMKYFDCEKYDCKVLCPYCKKRIAAGAFKCPYCLSDVKPIIPCGKNQFWNSTAGIIVAIILNIVAYASIFIFIYS